MVKATSISATDVLSRLVILALLGLIASCATSVPSTPFAPESRFVSRPSAPQVEAAVAAQLAESGLSSERYGLLRVYREKRLLAGAVQTAVLVEDEVVVVMKSGQTVVPVEAGEYAVAVGSGLPCDSPFANKGCDADPYPLGAPPGAMRVSAGQILTLEILYDKDHYKFYLQQQDGIDPGELPQLDARIARIDVPRPAANADGSVSQLAEVAEAPAAATLLPPEVMRDKLMLAIAKQLQAGRAAEALPMFEQLDQLPLPLDPDFDFYWGRTLLQAGQEDAGLSRLHRYLLKRGRKASHSLTALELIAGVEGKQ